MAKSLATLARQEIAAEKRVANVVIVARITFKDESRKAYSVYVVRSSDGTKTYTCTLVNGKATGCECASHKPCKHETACELAEQRIVAQKAARAQELATAEQVAPLIVGEQFNSDMSAHVEDEIVTQEESEFEAQAYAIVAAEAAVVAKTDPYHYKRYCALNSVAPKMERTPWGALVPMR